ncbi:UvrD-helicase domain-containing protein [Fictibacillus sp. FJAT-27399]|uniref:UvrD-helicase domain-containing protein n=1 Tax=Fictibacillus sp. FJAT-27399 TaxID=1729689 RepID=UPI00078065E1|nr:UvrD-helicase domain-containing protein [Fictibacillus sp. FJAT-27399]
MILVPENYNDLELTPSKKLLLSFFRKKLSDEYILFLELNPTGILNIPFLLVHKELGILCITIDETAINENLESYITLLKSSIWDRQEKILMNKLKRENTFLNANGSLSLGFNWVYLFPNIERSNIVLNDSFIKERCLFNKEYYKMFKQEFSIDSLFNSNNKNLTLDHAKLNTLGFTIAPEYYIPLHVEKINTIDTGLIINDEELMVKPNQQIVSSLALDSEQIHLVNKFNMGNHLLLACAGSGKSAVLIAKAFKFSSAYPDKKVLITCFNTNLAQYYQWRIDVAGFNRKNVQCRTFHSLCQNLLADYGIRNPYTPGTESYFNDVFNLVVKEFNAGNISSSFDAIFIDEVQIFKKEWYKLCFGLLKSKDKDQHLFVISGDKSQNINNNLEKGLAPWLINDPNYPTFETNTIRIEKNYRNSKQINNYINNFVSIAKDYLNTMSFEINRTEDLFLRGQSVRPGVEPQVIKSTRFNEIDDIFKTINILEEQNIPLSDIAILIPQRQYRVARYYILNWLKNRFNETYMDYTLLLNDEDAYERYGERKGVSICTIESALGLDFRAVILCGLLPLGLYEKSDKLAHLISPTLSKEDDLEKRKENFFKNINQLYTGMTRARDFLYIILTQEKENIYSNILLASQIEED